MKELALAIGKNGGGPTYTFDFPTQITALNNVTLSRLVSLGVSLLLFIAILLALFFLIFGGFKWMLSQGDKKELESAQKTIQYAIIGLVLVLVSFFIINFIGFIFGINLLSIQL